MGGGGGGGGGGARTEDLLHVGTCMLQKGVFGHKMGKWVMNDTVVCCNFNLLFTMICKNLLLAGSCIQ